MVDFKGTTHAAYALLWGFIFHDYLYVPAFVIGSLWPDCDIRHAMIARVFPLYLLPGIKHRGITHTIWGLITFTGLAWYALPREIALSFGAGYLLHLVMDSWTPMGIRWFAVTNPRYYRRRKQPKTRGG